jgi:hypothetical protein
MPAVPSCLLKPAWVEFSALIGGDRPQSKLPSAASSGLVVSLVPALSRALILISGTRQLAEDAVLSYKAHHPTGRVSLESVLRSSLYCLPVCTHC